MHWCGKVQTGDCLNTFTFYLQTRLLAERCIKCRWCLTDTREPVAAKLVHIQRCAEREKNALQLAKAAKVSRVVELIDEVEDDTDKGTWLVLEYASSLVSLTRLGAIA